LRGGKGINGHEAGVFEARGDAGDNCGFIGFCAVKEEAEVDELWGLALGILEVVKIWEAYRNEKAVFLDACSNCL
jgi:hypothetical protein